MFNSHAAATAQMTVGTGLMRRRRLGASGAGTMPPSGPATGSGRVQNTFQTLAHKKEALKH